MRDLCIPAKLTEAPFDERRCPELAGHSSRFSPPCTVHLLVTDCPVDVVQTNFALIRISQVSRAAIDVQICNHHYTSLTREVDLHV